MVIVVLIPFHLFALMVINQLLHSVFALMMCHRGL
jgi:hypothetical protein